MHLKADGHADKVLYTIPDLELAAARHLVAAHLG